MDDQLAKSRGYTHRAVYYGIDGYYNENPEAINTFEGKYALTDYLYEALVYLDMLVGFSEDGFQFKLKYRL